MKYKLVIFDLDGTLIDTIADLGGAANEVLRVKGFPRHTLEEYRGMVGHGVRNLVRKAMPEALQEDEALLDELLSLFLDYYLQHIDERSRPYQGMPELLAELRAAGVQQAVASNKFQAGTEKLIRRMMFLQYFPERFLQQRDRPEGTGPDPGVFQFAIRHRQIPFFCPASG